MKKNTISAQTVIKYRIDYENGFYCEYTEVDGNVTEFRFFNEKFKRLTYVKPDEFKLLTETHWSKHHEIITRPKVTATWLDNFKEFENLYYVGGGSDGMLAKNDGTFVSTPVILDYGFFQIYKKIENTEIFCQDYLSKLKQEYIMESEVVFIPYYNQNEERPHHYTLRMVVKVPDDIYIKSLGNKKHFDSYCNIKLVEFLEGKEI